MNSLKLKQFALALCVVLSLFASSYATCGCSHHSGKAETDAPSCHQEMAEMTSDEMPMSAGNWATLTTNNSCVCAQSAPRVFDKSPNVKIEKQAITILPRVIVLTESITATATAEVVSYTKPFYLSDSFYNIKSPRAPPRS